jgi:hypothetical protein
VSRIWLWKAAIPGFGGGAEEGTSLSTKEWMSTWGWAQNSLVSVDDAAKSFRYNHDYYLMKHLSHFVEVRAKRVETTVSLSVGA